MFGKEKMILPVNRLIGEVTLPGDKSISHRALMLAALAEGESVISNLSSSRDVYHTRMCLEELGVVIKDEGDHVRVFGAGLHGLKPPSRVLDAGNSGTTMRLLAGILAGQSFNSVLDGDESLRKRPMGRIITPLSRMGANITASEQNTAPLSIQGQPLQGIEYRSPIASAQVKSAILLAGLYASGETTVIEPAPSRNHTELMFEYLGIPIEREGLKTTLHPAPFKARDITIPGDFSAAAFFIVAALMVPNSYIIIRNVNLNPTRAFMLQLLKQAGAHIHVISESIRFQEKWGDLIIESSDIQPFEISGEMVPQLIDEIPILAVLATQARGTTLI
ncbi:MAG: 3-phosphoshikimate 1-carboxyvinyltransferase, partial [Methanobacteriota archaeon]